MKAKGNDQSQAFGTKYLEWCKTDRKKEKKRTQPGIEPGSL
jgi:hypothetical protein